MIHKPKKRIVQFNFLEEQPKPKFQRVRSDATNVQNYLNFYAKKYADVKVEKIN